MFDEEEKIMAPPIRAAKLAALSRNPADPWNLSRIYKFSRQKCRIYKFSQQKYRIYNYTSFRKNDIF